MGSERQQVIEKQGSFSLLRQAYRLAVLTSRNRGVSRSLDRLGRYRLVSVGRTWLRLSIKSRARENSSVNTVVSAWCLLRSRDG